MLPYFPHDKAHLKHRDSLKKIDGAPCVWAEFQNLPCAFGGRTTVNAPPVDQRHQLLLNIQQRYRYLREETPKNGTGQATRV